MEDCVILPYSIGNRKKKIACNKKGWFENGYF